MLKARYLRTESASVGPKTALVEDVAPKGGVKNRGANNVASLFRIPQQFCVLVDFIK